VFLCYNTSLGRDNFGCLYRQIYKFPNLPSMEETLHMNRLENKEAVDKARTLFQHYQLPDKYPRDISREIWKFHSILKCFYIYSTIYNGTHDEDLGNPGWETLIHTIILIFKGIIIFRPQVTQQCSGNLCYVTSFSQPTNPL
jgi:hypothetical protein